MEQANNTDTYDTSPLSTTTDIANIAVDSIITAKAKMGNETAQLVKLKMMQSQMAEQKKERSKDGASRSALLTMDDIAQSMVSAELKTRLAAK